EKVLTQTTSWVLNSRYVNVNSVSKVNVKSKVKNSYISRSVNDEFSLTDDEINSFKETLVLSSIDSLSKLVLNNPLSVLFTSTVRRNNNRAKINVEFDSWICTRCC
ncbi:protein YqeK, partial [Escherichia coli]|uniref:protein YqeK n=1 Tax=Escherichia coli TaxID=562 RepID=UPI0028790455